MPRVVPFRVLLRGGNGNGGPDASESADPTLVLELCEDGAKALVADAELSAQIGTGARAVDEGAEHVGGEVAVGCGVVVVDACDLEMQVTRGIVASEEEMKRLGCGAGSVLDGEGQVVAFASEVERRVEPCMEVAGAAEGLAEDGTAAVLAGVMDDDDGQVVLSLQVSQVREQARDVARVVLIAAM